MLAFVPVLGSASELVPNAGVGVIYSDNINRQTPAVGDEVVSAEAGLRYVNEAEVWKADIDARATYLDFLQKTYASETLGWGNANLGLTVLPKVLTLELQDNYGQVATDPFGALQPLDRQNINYLTTGPDLTLPLSRNDYFDLQGRYSAVDYSQTSTLNNQRYSGTAGLVHHITAIRSIGLNVYEQRTDFADPTSFRGYDLRSAFLSLVSSPRRSQYEFDAGATQVDDGLSKHASALFAVGFVRYLSDDSTVQFFGRRGFADSADSFRFQQGVNATTLLPDENVQVRADPYRETRADASLSSFKPRDTITLGAYWYEDQYVANQLFDRRDYGVYGEVIYLLTPELRIDSYVSYERDLYTSGLQDDKDFVASLSLSERLARSLDLGLQVARFTRRSTVTGNPFTENRVVLSLTYAPALRPGVAREHPTLIDLARETNSRPTMLQLSRPGG